MPTAETVWRTSALETFLAECEPHWRSSPSELSPLKVNGVFGLSVESVRTSLAQQTRDLRSTIEGAIRASDCNVYGNGGSLVGSRRYWWS
jgi:hypothetical protein